MSNPRIILCELNDLRESNEMIWFNLGRISMGSKEYNQDEQEALLYLHNLRIEVLEEKLVNLK